MAVRCGYCKSDRTDELFIARDINQGFPGQWLIHRCRNCSVVFTGADCDTTAFYPPGYYLANKPADINDLLKRNAGKLRLVTRLVKTGRILDVGCKTGEFLATLGHLGFEPDGVEPSKYAADYCRRHFGLQVRNGRLEELDMPIGHYDAVTLWQVVEHLSHPREMFGLLHDMLRPGGYLFLSFPDFQSPQSRIYGKYWFHLDIPRHLFHYTPSFFHRELPLLGFEPEFSCSFLFRETYVGWRSSLVRVLDRSKKKHRSGTMKTNNPTDGPPSGKFHIADIMRRPFNALFYAPAAIEAALKGGAIAVVVAKKRKILKQKRKSVNGSMTGAT